MILPSDPIAVAFNCGRRVQQLSLAYLITEVADPEASDRLGLAAFALAESLNEEANKLTITVQDTASV
jgi:hypothetical protein